jgi:uncharacterized protein (DUF924 family)
MFDWKDILDFWFGELDKNGLPDPAYSNRWFLSNRKFDQEIRRRFLSLVVFASEQGLDHWQKKAGGMLAEILLLDQFSRNIFRGGALAFEQDALARKLCKQGMSKGFDMSLPAIQRVFFYVPLQHSERQEDQLLAIECYEQLIASTSGSLREFMGQFLQSAVEHQAIITRFRRFPHRNKALGRANTKEESDYLLNGKRFGQ